MTASSLPLLSANRLRTHFVASALQILGASLFIALCAQIYIPLFFTPVPLSGQTFAIMLVGATMGSRKGLLSVAVYLLEGAFGLPVFVGGHFGFASLFGTDGGFFLGFMLQSYLVGWLMERRTSVNPLSTLKILLLSVALQLGIGSLWLSHFVGLENAFMLGFAPFVIGDTLKALGITAYLHLQHEKDSHLPR